MISMYINNVYIDSAYNIDAVYVGCIITQLYPYTTIQCVYARVWLDRYNIKYLVPTCL